MGFGNLENGCHLPLRLAGTHQPAVAAPAQCQSHRIQQNGLARAGFAGENGQPIAEVEIKRFNNDNVTNGERS